MPNHGLGNSQDLCKTIQTLATKSEEADLGQRDSDDPHAFKTHLTLKQQDKLIKLARRKCQVRCKLNGVELTALWDTSAQISLLSKKQLKEHFGDVEIQDVKLLLDDVTKFELTTVNRTPIPYCGWVKLTLRAPRGGRKRPPLGFSSVVFARGMILKRNFG